MNVPVTTLYAGLNALVALVLALLVVRGRQRTKTPLGSGGDAGLEQAIRAHGNFIEYVPLILLLMLVLELDGVQAARLHALGIALTLGRVLHAWGLHAQRGPSFGRAAGSLLTWATMLSALVAAIVIGLRAL
jgi:uncharacterized membrane protein YecN with MAPEG domain